MNPPIDGQQIYSGEATPSPSRGQWERIISAIAKDMLEVLPSFYRYLGGDDMQKRLKFFFCGAILLGTAAGIVAVTAPPADRSRDASRIVQSLALPQTAKDKLPLRVSERLPIKIDPTLTRLVGEGSHLKYYAVPADNKMCMIPVRGDGGGDFVGCTTLEGFESYGLRIENEERTEQAWLVIPSAADDTLESVKNDDGWTKQAPNLLLRQNSSDKR
ncbi:MAG: hypothetical protein ACLGH7_02150 [Actinomycetes bacterium]